VLFSRKRLKLLLKLIVFVATAVSLYVIVNDNLEVIESLSSINVMSFSVLLSLNIVFLYLFALMQHRLLLRRYGVDQTWQEWFGMAAIAALYNQVLPAKSGTVIRAAYLKAQYKLPFSRFGVSLILQLFYTTVVAIVFVAVALLLFMEVYFTITERALLATLLLGVAVSMMFFETRITRWISLKRGVTLKDSGRKKSVHSILAIIVAYIICRAFMFYFAFDAIGYTIPIYYCLLIAPIILISNLVSILPGNIGIKELLIGFILNALGYELSLSVFAAIIDRGAVLIVTVCCAIIFKIILLKPVKQK
jgi:uncharacterized membrane protein YbhN (UPF0104 family)